MNSSILKIASFLVVLLIILSILVIRSEGRRRLEQKNYEIELKRKQIEIDSLKFNVSILKKHYKDIYAEYLRLDSTKTKIKYEYKRIKVSPPIHYNNAELDSIFSAKYPR